ncbi:MAG: restriction endonuclease subunit S [Saprospiraceae bacterium]|nr:restriction endonuclease subunit S [Candidatus Defluviibacterium haderslevense]
MTKIKLGEVITHRSEFISIDDFQRYKLCRVQTKALGVVLREEKEGLEIKTKEQQVCKSGDLIFAEMDARFGGYGIIPEELNNSIVSSHYFLYDVNDTMIERKYLEYCMKQHWFLSQVEAKGTTNYAAIRPYHVLNYEIPLPSLPEQQRIISKIESVKQRIEQIEKLRAEQTKDIKNLLYSKYIDLIEVAEWLPMKEVAPIIRREVKLNDEALYPELGIRCFGKGTFHKPALTGLEVATKKIFQIKQDDLVFSNVFAWEGGIAVAKEEDNDRYGSHRFISCVADKERALEEFLCFHFLSPKGLEDINACSPGGAGRNKTLGLDKLMKIKVPIPDITLQKEFVELLHKVNALKEQHTETEKELIELMPALLDKAFIGGL